MSAVNDLRANEASPQKRGGDGAFIAIVHPLIAADVSNPEMSELRAICDGPGLRDARHWLRAIAFLRDLDALDHHLASGLLDAQTYASCLESRYRATPVESWLCTAGIARLVDRIITHRLTEKGRAS